MISTVFAPSVYIVGDQKIDDIELDRFLLGNDVESWETDTDIAAQKLVEVAGRTCYMSFAKPRPGGNHAYIEHILEVGHGSVLEHAVFNIIIEGVSRSFTHELVRHRAGMGYSQLSQRYVDEKDCKFVVPPALESEVLKARDWLEEKGLTPLNWFVKSRDTGPNQGDYFPYDLETLAGLRWLASCEISQDAYLALSNYGTEKLKHITETTNRRKAAREAARSVLPNATETKIFVTANARALRHFIEMRGNPAADAEIRAVALSVLLKLKEVAPNLFGDYEIESSSGVFVATTKYRKV